MSFSAPKPPDPTATANAQQGYNFGAATQQNRTNSYNQTNPFASVNYTPDASSPSGYTVNTTLSPAEQALLTQFQGLQSGLGGAAAQQLTGANTVGRTANELATNLEGAYSKPPDLDFSNTLKQLQGWQQSYVNPIFKQQESNLDAKLQNQGLAPGTEAYNNAQNLQARNEGDVNNQFFTQAEPLAFNQAVTNYQLPLQTLAGMFGTAQGAIGSAAGATGAAAPTTGTFQQTPTASIQPPNYSGLAEQNYQSQNQNYQNTLSGMFGIPTALAGGWARGGFGLPSLNIGGFPGGSPGSSA